MPFGIHSFRRHLRGGQEEFHIANYPTYRASQNPRYRPISRSVAERLEQRQLLSTSIISGQTIGDAITFGGQTASYTYTATAGQTFEASLGVPDQTSTFLPNLTIYDPNNVQLNTGGGTLALHSSIQGTVTNASAGTYTILVQADTGFNTGTYDLELDAAPATQAVDAEGDGGAITSGQTKSGNINRPGDLDVYTFTAIAGDSLSIDDAVTTGTPNVELLLFNPQGTQIDSGNSTIGQTFTESNIGVTGTYTVIMQDTTGTDSAGYTLKLTDTPGTHSPPWLAPDAGAVYTLSSNTLNITAGIVSILSDPTSTNPGLAITVSNSAQVTFLSTLHVGTLTLNDFATAVLSAGDSKLLRVTGLTMAPSASLDLTDNDMIFAAAGSTGLTTVTNLIHNGFNAGAGYWDGPGIRSSMAASDPNHLTAIGTKINSTGNPFDGEPSAVGDVLIKYTYYGDADLNGIVNGADYHQIDTGFGLQLFGWSNGDFNYDGIINRIIDGSDYTLIDNAFNQITAQGLTPLALVARIASPSATSATVFADSKPNAWKLYIEDDPNPKLI